jgi:hypothetical protein
MPDVFISYASQDKAIAEAINERLRAEGHEVYFDHALAAGEDWSDSIAKRLASSNVVIVLLSENTNRRSWVEEELRDALRRGRVVIPVLLDKHATENWVWPLISDREAIAVDSPEDIGNIVRQVDRVMHTAVGPPRQVDDAARATDRALQVACGTQQAKHDAGPVPPVHGAAAGGRLDTPSPLVAQIMGVLEESVSKCQMVVETGGIEALRAEAERQELAARMAESQARVAQELAIARRIETAEEVQMIEFYDYRGKDHLGGDVDRKGFSLGASGAGGKVTKRLYRFRGSVPVPTNEIGKADSDAPHGQEV